MFLEFLKVFMVGSITGGFVVRVWFRHLVGASMYDVRVNLSSSTNRKFRLLELVPFLGTFLTHFKHEGKNLHFARQAFGMELLSGLTVYVIFSLIENPAPLLLTLMWAYITIAVLFGRQVKAVFTEQGLELENYGTVVEKENNTEQTVRTKRRHQTRFTMVHLK